MATRHKTLILGGTLFLGRHIAQEALARGHEVTLFHRGKTNPDVFPQARHVIGDRKSDLSGLGGQTWDTVIDTCGYLPADVRATAQLLQQRAGLYVFISSISVYKDFSQVNDESSLVGTLENPNTEVIDGTTYGPLKTLCEQQVIEAFDGKALIIRPGLIVGPHDPTDRFTYWPARVAHNEPFAAPGAPHDPIQLIDARDLARWVVHCAEQRVHGIYNATSQPGAFNMAQLVDCCTTAAKARNASPVWIPAEFLAQHNVAAWTDMPVWVPATGDTAGLPLTRVALALAQGLHIRPLSETVRDTLDWHHTRNTADKLNMRAGLDDERHTALLAAWFTQQKTLHTTEKLA
jgi:2'-hydroxyisoflavone reductase